MIQQTNAMEVYFRIVECNLSDAKMVKNIQTNNYPSLYDHAIYKIHKGGCIVQIHPLFVYLFFSLN